ncbi:beta strand repeat-containing protein, partial [Belliella marina]
LSETIASLAPSGTEVFTTSHTVTQSDLDNGSVLNVATANGEDPNGNPVDLEDPTEGEEETPATQEPSFTLTKTLTSINADAGLTAYNAVGDILEYTITVTNTGNVTLSNIEVEDALTGLSETIVTLAPSGTETFPTTHTITQSDLDNGSVLNVATANGEDPNGDPVDPEDPTDGEEETPATQEPSFTILKELVSVNGDASITSYNAVGDVLEYAITVTNTGNVTLSNIDVEDALTGLSETIATLAPSGTETFPTTHTITQSDLDNGSVLNVATANGEDPNGDPVDPEDPTDGEEETPATQEPSFTITKSLTSVNGDVGLTSYNAVGDVLEYTITITNTGNVTLSNIDVEDALTGLSETIATLAPAGTQTFPTTHTVTQSDLDNGSVLNVATANGEDPNGDPVDPEDPTDGEEETPATQEPSFTLTKTLTSINADAGLTSYNAVGDVLEYTITVTNTGNVTLENLDVEDALTGLSETIATLSPSGTEVFTTSHTVTQSDLDNGSVLNVATANGEDPNGNPVDPEDPTDGEEETPGTQEPSFTITKTLTSVNGDVGITSYNAVGDVLAYTITVTNTGNVTLSNIEVEDALTGLSETIATLAPSGTETFPTTHTITQSDLDNGSVLNVATANGEDPNGNSVDPEDPTDGEEETPATQEPSFTILKELTSVNGDVGLTAYNAVGDILEYTITVTNTGNVTLENIDVEDALTGLSETIASLAPSGTEVFTTSHTVTQSDLDNGSVLNVATANGEDPNGDPVDPEDPTDGEEETPATQEPSFTILKELTSVNGDVGLTSYNAVGDVLEYTITVTNTGNVTLENIDVEDALTGLSETIATLAPSGTETFPTTHTITQSDLDNGSVLNVAIANGEDPNGNPVDPEDPTDGEEETPATQELSFTILKELVSVNGDAGLTSYNAVGDVLEYAITVTNTGNVTLSNIDVEDALTGLSETIASLSPSGTETFTTSHTVTQSDLDNGSVLNVATANGEDPNGNPVDPEDPTEGEEETPATREPSFTILKGLVSINGDAGLSSYNAVGDILAYTITITNTGNVTLENIDVEDALTGLSETIATLVPSGTETFTTSHTVTQSDLDNGSVLNVATAIGEDPNGDPVDPEDPTDGEEETPATQEPSFTILKELASVNGDVGITSYDAVGDVLAYTITVTNTGNVTLENIEVEDALTGLSETIATLAPSGIQTFTTSHTITQSDLDNGSVLNVATANGEDPNGDPVDPEDPTDGEEETPATQEPSFTILKELASVNGDVGLTSYNAVGDILEYTITVTNTGNVTLENIEVEDALTGLSETIATLAPSGIQTFTTSHTITQSDLDNGSVLNVATANGEDPNGDPVNPEDPTEGEEETPATQEPSFTLTKTLTSINADAGTTSYNAVGDVLEYTITVTNTGNVTLENLDVEDALTGLSETIATLAPAGTQTFPTTHTITQSDLDNGSVLNVATANGEDPNGNPVDPEDPTDGEEETPATQEPSFTITKSLTSVNGDAGLTSYNAVGDVLEYAITITNTGNVTLENIDVEDALTGLSETIATLAPAGTQTFPTTHTITQSDLDNGFVLNVATANGEDPNGDPVDPEDPTD